MTSHELMDFLDFGEGSDSFEAAYATLNQVDSCDSTSPSELSASIEALPEQGDVDMCDFTLSSAVKSWEGVSDQFSGLKVKQEPLDKALSRFDVTSQTWNGSRSNVFKVGSGQPDHVNTSGIKSVPLQSTTTTTFTMSQIAPPLLPAEHQSASSNASIADSIKEEEEEAEDRNDVTEPASKRRASEASQQRKNSSLKGGHKRSASTASAKPTPTPTLMVSPPVLSGASSADPAAVKRQDRLMRNRAAALASRERKREHVSKLESSVIELESDKLDLKKQVYSLNKEVMRLRERLQCLGFPDEGEPVEVVVEIPEGPNVESESIEHSMITKIKAAPTGFSPRGALKKSQYLVRQQAEERAARAKAQEALREQQQSQTTVSTEDSEMSVSSPLSCSIEEANEESSVTESRSIPGPAVVFMILILGCLALLAPGNTVAPFVMPDTTPRVRALPAEQGDTSRGEQTQEESSDILEYDLVRQVPSTEDMKPIRWLANSPSQLDQAWLIASCSTPLEGDCDEAGKTISILSPLSGQSKSTRTRTKKGAGLYSVLECVVKKKISSMQIEM